MSGGCPALLPLVAILLPLKLPDKSRLSRKAEGASGIAGESSTSLHKKEY